MLFTEYLVFAGSIGWLVALMMAAVVLSLPGGFGRRHVGWLFAFCATRILAEFVALALLETAPDTANAFTGAAWRSLAAIASGMVLWEFARRLWNDQVRPRLSAATHLLAAECIALVAAVTLALGDAARPGWFAPIAFATALLPGVLGFASALVLWRCLDRETDSARRTALRTAALGLGAFALFSEMPGLSAGEVLPPWIAVGGLGAACLALPAARTRFTLACGVGLFVAVVAGPFATSVYVDRLAESQRERLLARDTATAAAWQGWLAATLEPTTLASTAAPVLREKMEKLRAADPLLREAAIWKLHGDRVHVLSLVATSPVEFVDARPATPAEKSGVARARSFMIPPVMLDASDGLVRVHVPLRASAFDTPAAWLALEYVDALWLLQRQHARRGGLALCGALAAFCVIGFVLAVRHALENAQQLAIERAQSADKAKTEFLAFLSHEMRTPLQTILGRSEFIRREAPTATRHAAAIETQGLHLLRLVTDLLDLGTIEAGKLKLQPAPFALRPLLASLEEMHGPIATAKGLALDLAVAPDVPDHLLGDEARLRQILGNLLGNAVKFTSQGRVTLRVTTGDSGQATGDRPDGESRLLSLDTCLLFFTVIDTGPGLPPDKIPQLFTLFTRLDSGATFTREGTGVGLALVRRLCDLMGGTATAANRPAGGAEFTVRLVFPLAETRASVEQTSGASLSANMGGRPMPRGMGVSPVGLWNAEARSCRVLLAEDHTATRELLTEALQNLGGFEVVAVADGPAALAAAGQQAFDAAVLDVNLPGIDGIALARTLRTQHPALRIVGCSAEALPAVRDAALAAGMDEFLVKPVALDALARALRPKIAEPSIANVYDLLRSPTAVAHTHATLRAEWPQHRAAAESAFAAGDSDALRQLAHYLQSSALLLADAPLNDLCRRLSAADSASPEIAAKLCGEVDRHISAWPHAHPSFLHVGFQPDGLKENSRGLSPAQLPDHEVQKSAP